MNGSIYSVKAVKFGLYGLFVTVLCTVTLMVYAAHPWGDNYAYQTLTDYIFLTAFAFWAVIPYLALMLLIQIFHRHKISIYVTLIGAGIICLASVGLLIDMVFIHVDAQGSLLFLFLPVYQWVAIFILGVICVIVNYTLEKTEEK